jgi:hypothetical protein
LPKLPKRRCAYPGCDVLFTPGRKNQVYHDPIEGKKASVARSTRGELPPRRCAFPGCSVEFTPARATQVYHDSSEGVKMSSRRRRPNGDVTTPEGEYGRPGNAGQYEPARVAAPRYPEGWEPGVRLDGTTGHIVTRPTADREPRFEEHLKAFGFDPDEYEIVEPIQVRTWDSQVPGGSEIVNGRKVRKPNQVVQMWYYRASVRRRTSSDIDVQALVEEIRKAKPRKPAQVAEGEDALVVGLADWQLGKSDGDGVQGTVDRVLASIDGIEARVNELRKAGRPLGALYLADMGDIFEACFGHYAMQTFKVDLDRRQQKKLGRRLIVKMIQRLAPLFPRVVVLGVPGNHGENRQMGKAATSFGDNDDVAVVEELAEIFDGREGFGHVSFVYPDEDLVVTLRIAEQTVAFAHGHQARGGGSIDTKIESWWKGQGHGMRPAGDATVLFTGHYHHLRIVQNGPRTWFQCPSIEGGSQWWTEQSGESSPRGTLTVRITPQGWSDLAVI